MRDSTVPAFLAALQTALSARSGVKALGATVWTAHPGNDATATDITFLGSTTDSDWALTGEGSASPRDEHYEVLGDVLVILSAQQATPGLSSTETTIQAARASAYALLKEITDQLRTDTSVGQTVLQSQLHHARLDQGPTASGERWCQIQFSIRVRARI